MAVRDAVLADAQPIELTAQAGDVVMLHPMVLHARSKNLGARVRFITNPCITLYEPMQLTPARSPVECAIAEAIYQA